MRKNCTNLPKSRRCSESLRDVSSRPLELGVEPLSVTPPLSLSAVRAISKRLSCVMAGGAFGERWYSLRSGGGPLPLPPCRRMHFVCPHNLSQESKFEVCIF